MPGPARRDTGSADGALRSHRPKVCNRRAPCQLALNLLTPRPAHTSACSCSICSCFDLIALDLIASRSDRASACPLALAEGDDGARRLTQRAVCERALLRGSAGEGRWSREGRQPESGEPSQGTLIPPSPDYAGSSI